MLYWFTKSAKSCGAVLAIVLCGQTVHAENRIEHFEIYPLYDEQEFYGELRINAGNVMDLVIGQNAAPAQITQTTETRAARNGAQFYNVVAHIVCDSDEPSFSAPIEFKSEQLIDSYVQTFTGNKPVWVGGDGSTAGIDCKPGHDDFDRFMIETSALPDQIVVLSGDKRFGFRKQKGPWYLSDQVQSDLLAQAQQKLNELGYEAGTPDGVSGPKTRAALRAFQKAENLPASDTLDTASISALKLKQTKGAPVFVSQPGDNASLPTAAAIGGFYSVWALLQTGADPNSKNQYGTNALSYAASKPLLDIVKLLVDAGANVDFHDKNNAPPLVAAAGGGQVKTVRFLLENGAQPDLYRAESRTALGNAAYHGYHDVVETLLAAGADIDSTGGTRRTALVLAAAQGHQQIVYTLMDAGADPRIEDDVGRTAAIYAAGRGFAGIFRTMIEAGVDVNHQATDGSTALWFAIQNGHEDAVYEALDLGANPNTVVVHGQTPLIFAAYLGHEQIVRMLLHYEADPAIKSDDGRTALGVASSAPILKLLRAAVDPNKVQYALDDFAPLTIALRQIEPDQALLDYAAKMLTKSANNVAGYLPEFTSSSNMDVSICFGDWGGRDGRPVELAFRDFIANYVVYEREFKRLKLPESVWKDKLDTATAIALASSYQLLHEFKAGEVSQEQGWKLEDQVGNAVWLLYDELSNAIRAHNLATSGSEGDIHTVVRCVG